MSRRPRDQPTLPSPELSQSDPNLRAGSAFVLPNGTIFVFTGILPVAADADGLACILGHGEDQGDSLQKRCTW